MSAPTQKPRFPAVSTWKDTLVELPRGHVKALQDFGIPGLAMAVVADDQLVLAKGYGLRDIDQELPVTPETLFAIGSTSKAFTAFIIGQLVDEGLVEWDEPVVSYMPEFRLFDEYATRHLLVRVLLIHSSGLPRHDLAWYNQPLMTPDSLFKVLRYFEPNRDLRRRNDHHKKNEYLAIECIQLFGKSDQRQINGIQHQLNRHKNNDSITPR